MSGGAMFSMPAALAKAGWSVRFADGGRIVFEKKVDSNWRDPAWNWIAFEPSGGATVRCAAGHPLSAEELEAIAGLARAIREAKRKEEEGGETG